MKIKKYTETCIKIVEFWGFGLLHVASYIDHKIIWICKVGLWKVDLGPFGNKLFIFQNSVVNFEIAHKICSILFEVHVLLKGALNLKVFISLLMSKLRYVECRPSTWRRRTKLIHNWVILELPIATFKLFEFCMISCL